MESVAQVNPLDEAIRAYTTASNDVGVLNITVSARYRALLDALKGFGDLATARYAFAMECDLLANAQKQWKVAADALEILIAHDVEVHPETGEHTTTGYVYENRTPVHPNCACDGGQLLRDRPVVTLSPAPYSTFDGLRSLPFPEASAADSVRGCECDGEIGCSSPLCDAKTQRADRQPTLRDVARGTTGNGGGR